jgi:hypothetical protein
MEVRVLPCAPTHGMEFMPTETSFVQTAGRRALNAKTVVRIHQGVPGVGATVQGASEPFSLARWTRADCRHCNAFRTSSSAVERRVEGARVGGSIPSLCTTGLVVDDG